MLKTPQFWQRTPAHGLAISLRPLAWAYQVGAKIHQSTTRPAPCPLPLVCIGNLSVGGSGKTPLVRALAQALQAKGHRVLLLSKGFGGTAKGPVLVAPSHHSAAQVGDEPLLLAQDAPVLVSQSRKAAMAYVQTACSQAPCPYDLVLMDDGMQNPSLEPDLCFAVIDAGVGFGNGLCFPAGPLREPLGRGLKRVDQLILVQTGQEPAHASLAALPSNLEQHWFTTQLPPASSPGPVLAFCGIGRPDKFFASLKQAGYTLADTQDFPDHHPFSLQDLRALKHKAQALGASLATTEKDWVRLPQSWQAEIRFIPLQLSGALAPLVSSIEDVLDRAPSS